MASDYVYAVPGEYTFVRCRSCKHIFINPRPADQVLMDCYPANYAPHLSKPGATDSVGNRSEAPTRSFLRRWLRRLPLLRRFLVWLGQQHATVIPDCREGIESRLLEVGCAHGGYLAQATAAGWQVDGIEPDAAAAERAKDRGFNVQLGTLTDAGIPNSSREAVVAWMVLEHVPDPLAFVQDAYRILAPGGVFCVSVPNSSGLERYVFGRYWLGYDAPRHLQVFSARRLTELLHDCGFVDIEVIHQASIRYWWGSVAAWGMDRWPAASWPRRWMRYFIGDPPPWMKWASLLPEKLLAAIRMSGRITVIANKPRATGRD
jgi:SAM-dependent methyltransferase